VERARDGGDEPSVPCETSSVCNPRDGLVTLLAVVEGEEDWVDMNSNGVADSGEYADLGEPFVDVNDDGTFNPGESYLDHNSNGRWDGPNGQYDELTVISKTHRIVWTGGPVLTPTGFYEPPSGDSMPPALVQPLSIPRCGSREVSVLIVDDRLNVPAYSEGDSISCSCDGSLCQVSSASFDPVGRYGRRLLTLPVADSRSCSATSGADSVVRCTANFHGGGGSDSVEVTLNHPIRLQ